jgi:hypothetical protein
MATFGGKPSPTILGGDAWEGYQVKQVDSQNLPAPSNVINDTANLDNFPNISDIPNGAFTPVVVSIHVNTQQNYRGKREKNLVENGGPQDGMDYGFDWFERIHIKPQEIALGNIVSTVTQALDLFNAYRNDSRIWTAFINNAGAGISALNLPSLPKTIPKLSSFELTIEITPNGPPTIDGTLDFTFDTTSSSIPITGTRIILFGIPPSGGLRETLSWLTDIMRGADGTEQRLAVRRYPRQQIQFETLISDDRQRSELNSFLFDWHARIFGVPLWWDARLISENVSISDTSVRVASTDNADFRVGGLAAIISYDASGRRTADTLEITAVSSSPATITFSSGVENAYTAGQAVVIPVVPGILDSRIRKSRYPSTAQKMTVSFESLDNDISRLTADTAAFSQHNSKAVIDDKNYMNNELREGQRITTTILDGNTGEIVQYSDEDRSTFLSRKRWNVETASRLWEIKSLLYALRGRQVSFYMPTFNADIIITSAVIKGASSIDIQNIGYNQFIKDREPFTTIAIRFKDGFVPEGSPLQDSPVQFPTGRDYLFLDISSSTELSADEERLNVTPAIPISFGPDDIERIEFMIVSRFDTDTVELLHRWTDTLGEQIDSELSIPTAGVYDT